MLPYSAASCLINELNKEPISVSEKYLDDSTATSFTTFQGKVDLLLLLLSIMQPHHQLQKVLQKH